MILTDSNYIHVLIINKKVYSNSTSIVIKKVIRLCKSYNKYYHKITQLCNLADKKIDKKKLLLNNREIFVFFRL